MIKKTVQYTDFDGNSRSETYYFNLSRAELIELEVSEEVSFSDMLKHIVETNNNREIVRVFKKVMFLSVGKKSEDGRRIIKNDDIRNDFFESDAFSELFFSLASDSDQMTSFINGIVPSNLEDKPSAPVRPA